MQRARSNELAGQMTAAALEELDHLENENRLLRERVAELEATQREADLASSPTDTAKANRKQRPSP